MMPQLNWVTADTGPLGKGNLYCMTAFGLYLIKIRGSGNATYLFQGYKLWMPKTLVSLEVAAADCQEHFEKQCLALVKEPAWIKSYKDSFCVWDNDVITITMSQDSKFQCKGISELKTNTIEEMKLAIHKHIAEDILSKLNLIL